MAHIGVSTIKELASAGRLQIAGSPGPEFKMEDCEACAIARATRPTFADVSVRGNVPLEIVHSVVGPVSMAMCTTSRTPTIIPVICARTV